MEKRCRIEAEEIRLPEEVIQHIQSFLSGKEAARTTILSKPWYAAWLTRPNLDFMYLEFQTPSAFVEHVKKTMQRYEDLNRKIHTLRLQGNAHTSDTVSTAKEIILKAIKLGATDLYIDGGWIYSLPLPSDMFESETLVRLSLHDCKIDLRDQKVNCMRLKYLKLTGARMKGITFWDISWMCPLIEELSIAERGIWRVHSMTVLEPGLGVYVFCKLKVLSLEDMEIGEGAFDDFSSKFPCLKELALRNCIGRKEIQICSNSLECISFSYNYWVLRKITGTLRATLDVPRIRKFKYSGSRLPSVSFKTIPREWEWASDISIINIYRQLETSWFLELRECLHELSPSKISLHLDINTDRVLDHYYGYHNPKPPIAVEDLALVVYLPSSHHRSFLDGIFRCCRPSFVYLDLLPLRKANNDFIKLLCETLTKGSGEKQSMSVLRDLEEVNVDFFIEGCTTLPCKTLPDALAYSGSSKIHVCLQLRWGESF